MNNKTSSDEVPIVAGATSGIDRSRPTELSLKRRYMKTKCTTGLLALIMTAAVSPVTWAAPHAGGGAVVSSAYLGGSHFDAIRTAPAFAGGQLRAAPALQGAYFTGRSISGLNRVPNFYYRGAGTPSVGFHGATASANPPSQINGRMSSISSQQDRTPSLIRQNTRVPNPQVATTGRQQGRVSSGVPQNTLPNPRTSTSADRQLFLKNHASERHDANSWHRDWNKQRAHFHNKRVFVFVDGFWWGLYPWDYYPYYASDYPYNYDNGYPYDYYNEYPDGYYDSAYPTDYGDPSSYTGSEQSLVNAMVTSTQSELVKLGYYHGAIDGVVGDETQAALARYQEDHDLSVTGTLTSATLQSLGL